MTYLLNSWYMIAWSNEISGEHLFTRKILDMPILVYRDPVDQKPRAFFDRCPHRFAPLSRGELEGGRIRCGYHGLLFDESGQCVHNPFSKAVPSAAKVRTFPIVETDGTIWVWTGDAPADMAKLPVISHHADPQFRYVSGLTTAKSDYRLLSDNLMDLSHTTFLHPAFGGRDYLPKFRCWEEKDGSIVSDHYVANMPNFLGEMVSDATVNHRDTIRWIAPAVHILDSHTTSVVDETTFMFQPSAHILTPETRTTTHYFWSAALPVDSPMPDEEMIAILRLAFDEEDKPMVEAVQSRMGDAELWDLNPILLPNDAGAVRVRRKLSAMIEAEQSDAPSRLAAQTAV
ncbi:aromatic ring-hydroxylating dioxygenase subunit alpha [Sphingobium sp. CFD-1]|uniref:aromatic ring-hydroxylating dioxygenase subunit alpha n=1 Tax=Sphingobium sp. CFD-1 TaxID=2878545 RepID=UPI00214AC9A3|nr:aromatic ring-hydroxylating dioxygenase subunit alpha [Sphingobium sp. CFD-1]